MSTFCDFMTLFWYHHKQCIQTGTNMPGVCSFICEIDVLRKIEKLSTCIQRVNLHSISLDCNGSQQDHYWSTWYL